MIDTAINIAIAGSIFTEVNIFMVRSSLKRERVERHWVFYHIRKGNYRRDEYIVVKTRAFVGRNP